MTTRTPPATATRSRWWVPAGLLALGFVPVLAGTFRVGQLASGGRVTAENARFFASPVPVVLHIVGATVFLVLGAFQFVPSLRRHAWHRRAGRLVLPGGLVAALAALWMTVFYPHPPGDGDLLTAFRLVFGAVMLVALVLGLRAIRDRDVAAHRAWVTRAYAIGVAAGTQAVFVGLWEGLVGPEGVTGRALLLGAAWVFNLVVAERTIRKGRR
ncbi:DUF2306 domain-containing protein [Actinophytocola sp.]|uniref:DUF2306 domain-containing protein n=1 Tax=Actinophytocola sp. TaxID=1872138 RepID=UPI00389B1768